MAALRSVAPFISMLSACTEKADTRQDTRTETRTEERMEERRD